MSGLTVKRVNYYSHWSLTHYAHCMRHSRRGAGGLVIVCHATFILKPVSPESRLRPSPLVTLAYTVLMPSSPRGPPPEACRITSRSAATTTCSRRTGLSSRMPASRSSGRRTEVMRCACVCFGSYLFGVRSCKQSWTASVGASQEQRPEETWQQQA